MQPAGADLPRLEGERSTGSAVEGRLLVMPSKRPRPGQAAARLAERIA
ncbi:MAG: hypothetical protein AAFT19_01825 [Pseudomonadota bacterium]